MQYSRDRNWSSSRNIFHPNIPTMRIKLTWKTHLSLFPFIFRWDCCNQRKKVSTKTKTKFIRQNPQPKKWNSIFLFWLPFFKRKSYHLVSFRYSLFLYENLEIWHEAQYSYFSTIFSLKCYFIFLAYISHIQQTQRGSSIDKLT